MIRLFGIAFRSLWQHPRRTLILGGAIAGVMGLLTAMLCLAAGVHATLFETATTIAAGPLNIGGIYKISAEQAASILTDPDRISDIVRRTVPDVTHVVGRVRGNSRVVSEKGSLLTSVMGVDIQEEQEFRRTVQLVAGRFDDLLAPNTILLFQEQAKRLEVSVGDTVTLLSITARGTRNSADVRVAAVARDAGILSTSTVYVPSQTLRTLNQLRQDAVGALLIYTSDPKQIGADRAKLRAALSLAGYKIMEPEARSFWIKLESAKAEEWTGQKLDVTTWQEELPSAQWILDAIDGLAYVLSMILLIIISVGIMNSMWIAIRERTREIGTLRAIGVQRVHVMMLFLTEGLLLGLLGTLTGAGLSLAAMALLNAVHVPTPEGLRFVLVSDTIRFMPELRLIVLSSVVISSCVTVISIVPALYAARLRPITAMQYIG